MIEDFRVQQIENLLIIASNRDSSKRAIFTTVEAFVLKNIEKLDAHSIPAIFFNFSENQIGSERFYSAIENKLVSMAHQLTTEMLAKCSWGFAMAKTARGSLFFKKAAEVRILMFTFIKKNASKYYYRPHRQNLMNSL